MKKIEAIIRTSKFQEIYKCVAGLGVKFLSFYEVKGMGLEHARPQTYRGVAFEPT
jgi:nitrogen regulatory protein P-II 1